MRPTLPLLLLSIAAFASTASGARCSPRPITATTTTIISRRLFLAPSLLRQPRALLFLHTSSSRMGRTGKPAASAASAAASAAVKTEGGSNGWIDLGVAPSELRPEFSLNMGQCFNWKRRLPGNGVAMVCGWTV